MSANNNADAGTTRNGGTSGPTAEAPGAADAAGHHFESFEEFWPYYVAMHSRPETRFVHAVGTITAGLVALSGLIRFRPKLKRLLLAPIIGYGAAWGSHWLIERNNPATIGYPAWAFQGDLEMLSMMLQGRDDELTDIAREWFEAHPEDRSAGSLTDEVVPA